MPLIQFFPQKYFYKILIIPLRFIYTAHFVCLDMTILIIFGNEYIYKVPSAFWYFPILCSYILLSTLL